MRCFRSDPEGEAMFELARLRAALMNPSCHASLAGRASQLVNEPGEELTIENIDRILAPLFDEDLFESFVNSQTEGDSHAI